MNTYPESLRGFTEYKESYLNIGTGKDYTIKWYVDFVSKQLNYKTVIKFDRSMPDGTKRKLTDVSRLNDMGWKSSTEISDGVVKMIQSYDD